MHGVFERGTLFHFFFLPKINKNFPFNELPMIKKDFLEISMHSSQENTPFIRRENLQCV